MCGIAGIWGGFSDSAPERVQAMLDAMRHRGPDGRGAVAFEGGAAGMVRLALVDLSPRGLQPLWSQDRRVAIVFNGEIYNFRAERARLELAGYRFRTTTDTEVVLALYLERGPAFVERMRGMFALAIMDWRETAPDAEPTLFLARDPFGIKPLYASRAGARGVAFASEIKALVAAGLVSPEVNAAALTDVLSFGFVLQPDTILRAVRMLEPGTLETYRPGRPALVRRFFTRPSYEPREESLSEASARLRSVLEESVKLHATADAKVGAFLSGGVDSTALVGMMREHVADLRTYTLRFPDLPGTDEADLAAATARRFGCVNTMVEVTGDDVAAILPQFFADLDQPSSDGLNTWLVSRAAAKDVKGVLSGVGGDELFAGYPVTRRMAELELRRGSALRTVGQLAHLATKLLPQARERELVKQLTARRSPVAQWLQPHTVFSPERARALAGIGGGASDQIARLVRIADALDPGWQTESAVGRSHHLDWTFYMGCQLLRDADAISMAHSLELRVPFVDLEMLRFSRSCLDRWKLDPGTAVSKKYGETGSKRVLIEALRDLLPSDLERRPKRGFALPFGRWLDGSLAETARAAMTPVALRRGGLIDADALGAGSPTAGQRWLLLVIDGWQRSLSKHAPRSARPRSQWPPPDTPRLER